MCPYQSLHQHLSVDAVLQTSCIGKSPNDRCQGSQSLVHLSHYISNMTSGKTYGSSVPNCEFTYLCSVHHPDEGHHPFVMINFAYPGLLIKPCYINRNVSTTSPPTSSVTADAPQTHIQYGSQNSIVWLVDVKSGYSIQLLADTTGFSGDWK